MPLVPYLQSLGATHLLLLEEESTAISVDGDFGDSPDRTRLRLDQLNTQWNVNGEPICEGVKGSLLAFGVNTDFTTRELAAEIDARSDINANNNGNLGSANDSSTYNWNTGSRAMMCWFNQTVELLGIPTAIMGHGASSNNQVLTVGLGGRIVFQAADQGQPYLAISSLDNFQVGRSYFIVGLWEHHTQHSGAGNRITLYVNGVEQGRFELNGTDPMAPATGQPFLGNASSLFQSYGGGTIGYLRREKLINLAGFYNNQFFSEDANTESDFREIFERTVIPEVTIESDTVENQQDALDLIRGNEYIDVNCAVRIIQATDAIDYRLFLDDVTTKDNPNTGDIAVQFVGSGNLTLEKANGSNALKTSTPPEVERTSGILVGGGSITLLAGVRRLTEVQNLVNDGGDKLVLEASGIYNLTNSPYNVIEVIKGATVQIVTDSSVGSVLETDGTIALIDVTLNVSTPNGFDDEIKVFSTQEDAENEVNELSSGSSFSYPRAIFNGQIVWYRLESNDGSVIIVSQLLDFNAGVHEVPLVVTEENASLSFIRSVSEKLETMIEVSNGNQVFTAEALENAAGGSGGVDEDILNEIRNNSAISANNSVS